MRAMSYDTARVKLGSRSSAKPVDKTLQLADDSVGFAPKSLKYAACADTQVAENNVVTPPTQRMPNQHVLSTAVIQLRAWLLNTNPSDFSQWRHKEKEGKWLHIEQLCTLWWTVIVVTVVRCLMLQKYMYQCSNTHVQEKFVFLLYMCRSVCIHAKFNPWIFSQLKIEYFIFYLHSLGCKPQAIRWK